MRNEYIAWRNLRIHIQASGQGGEPLLLINGLGANTDMWAPFIAGFPDRHIMLFDAPGTGRSETPLHPIMIDALADLAVAVLEHRGIDQADVIGYSYGGAIAQELAVRHPGRINKLVLAATNCGLGAVLGSPQVMFVLSTPFRYYSKSYFMRIAASLYGGRTARNETVREQMMTSRNKFPPSSAGYSMQIMAGSGWSSVGYLHQIAQPTLVISGDDDPLIPIENAHFLAARIPNARLDIVEGAGHLFLIDDAEHLAARVRQFIGPPLAASAKSATA